MVGLGRAMRSYSSAEFGPGEGPIVLDNVECLGTEENLGECQNDGLLVNNCQHSEDAGVRCAGKCEYLTLYWLYPAFGTDRGLPQYSVHVSE